MIGYCKHCGSKNHQSFDCPNDHLTYVPPPGAEQEPEPVPVPTPEPVKPVIVLTPSKYFGRPFCSLDNRLAFDDQQQIKAYFDKNALHTSIKRVWQCECGKWHFEADQGRNRSKYPREQFVPFRRKIRESAFEAQLPVQKKPEKEIVLPRAKPKPKEDLRLL
jgi:hypothetical protein